MGTGGINKRTWFRNRRGFRHRCHAFSGCEITEFPNFWDTQKYVRKPNFFRRVSNQTPCKNQSFKLIDSRLWVGNPETWKRFGNPIFRGGFPKGNQITFLNFAPSFFLSASLAWTKSYHYHQTWAEAGQSWSQSRSLHKDRSRSRSLDSYQFRSRSRSLGYKAEARLFVLHSSALLLLLHAFLQLHVS